MERVRITGEVGAAIAIGRDGGSKYHTNFFVQPGKLEGWIAHGELFVDGCRGATLFLRKDRDIWHLYFCATNLGLLQRAIEVLAPARLEPTVVDLIGNGTEGEELVSLFERAGFRPYTKLIRMALIGKRGSAEPGSATGIGDALRQDCDRIGDLLLSTFDRRAEQIPQPYEIVEAVEARQILLAERGNALAGLLFSETYGLTSTIRYWVVAREFRAQGVGSDLIRWYFANHTKVRRFLLWVVSDNDDAAGKYAHYGFAPDGLVDYVFANQCGQA